MPLRKLQVQPPIQPRAAILRFAGICATFAVVALVVDLAILEGFDRMMPRFDEKRAAWVAAGILVIASVAAMKMWAVGVGRFVHPALAWGQYWLGNRVYLSGEWLLERKGDVWVFHQSTAAILRSLPTLAGMKGLFRDINALRDALSKGALPEVEKVRIPAGFLCRSHLEKLGYQVSKPKRVRGIVEKLGAWYMKKEIEERARLVAEPSGRKTGAARFRDVATYPYEGTISRDFFVKQRRHDLHHATTVSAADCEG